MGSPEQEAIERVQVLFIRHTDVIRGFIRGLLPDAVRADDVLQETFLTLTRKADDFDPLTSFPRWACAVARFKVMEERRVMGKTCGMLSPDVMEALAVTEGAFALDPRLDRLGECLGKLPDSMRRLLRLRYHEDHSVPEIADRIGWSVNAVHVGLSRARALLRECIESKATPSDEPTPATIARPLLRRGAG